MLPEPDPRLLQDLCQALGPGRVLANPLDRLARSADASIYRLVPEAVVRPRGVAQVRALFQVARRHGRSLTFRAAGTSLSGQAVTGSILVELAHDWGAFRVLDDGRRVWSQPGVTGGLVNRRLAPLGYRLGPDPASIDAAMLGGILANNASGMCCGTAESSYRTLESLSVLLADGTLVETGRPGADERLPEALRRGLLALRDDLRGDAALAARVRHKFVGKNTTGYRLDAFLDFDAPAEILARLMVGSQGTLGFVAEATLRTVPELPLRATALLLFDRLREAGAVVPALAAAGVLALEILDAASLRSQAGARALPVALGDDTAGLLVEVAAADETELATAVERAQAALRGAPLAAPAAFTRDPEERARHWTLRKGLFPSVGAARPPGTSVVIEDVAFPVPRLAEAIADLQALFARHGYAGTAVFGHAREGNLHFTLAEDFGDARAVERYDGFMRALVELVVGRYDGALKAEHGSGRNMAPFVRDEWGPAAYEVMWRLKRLLDPEGLLNPGVLLSDDPRAHLRHLKDLPAVSPLVDRCIECGFCEPRCPSRDASLSPRQRIAARRALARLGRGGAEESLRAELESAFEGAGLQTCVGDGSCAAACPVEIDTGALVKELKAARHPAWAKALAGLAARHFALTSAAARAALSAAGLLRAVPGGSSLLQAAAEVLHALAPTLVPELPPALALPRPAPPLTRRRVATRSGREAVYFPTCLTRVIGPLPGEPGTSLAETVLEALEAAGWAVRVAPRVESLCCGVPFASKGFPEAAREAGRRAAEAVWQLSEQGRRPILADASPCAAQLDQALRALHPDGAVLDFAAFWARHGLPHLARVTRLPGEVALHPTCTLLHAGGLPELRRVAEAHAERAFVPAAAECCGFAGDRGFLVPEVTAAATRREAAELGEGRGAAGAYSTCRTCEIGLTRATGRPWRHLAELVRDSLRRS